MFYDGLSFPKGFSLQVQKVFFNFFSYFNFGKTFLKKSIPIVIIDGELVFIRWLRVIFFFIDNWFKFQINSFIRGFCFELIFHFSEFIFRQKRWRFFLDTQLVFLFLFVDLMHGINLTNSVHEFVELIGTKLNKWNIKIHVFLWSKMVFSW